MSTVDVCFTNGQAFSPVVFVVAFIHYGRSQDQRLLAMQAIDLQFLLLGRK